jgi:tetratricopeptide (TPR) repeat protein
MSAPATLYEEAVAAFNRRDWRTVLERAQRLLPVAPDHAGLHYITGVAALESRLLPQAARHLERAESLDPGNSNYAALHARILVDLRLSREALLAADRGMALEPQDAATLDTLGVVYSLCNAHDRAAAAFRRAVALAPDHAQYGFNLATASVALGDIEAAEQGLETSLQKEPRLWTAHLTLAQLRKQTASSNHIPRLLAVLPGAESDPYASMNVHLALSKEYEDLGDYPASFEHLTLGKAAGRKLHAYSTSRDEALFKALTIAFPQPINEPKGYDSSEPIFIIGMPRSGTTLVERIISSHPDVYSAGELQNFSVVLKRASGSRTSHLLDPDTIGHALHIDWKQLGRDYIESTRPLTATKPRFIDKLPHNFLYAGFIAQALPNAKIICLRRNPLDTCLSNFRQLFAQTSPYYDYSYDLLDTGRYFALFDRLMAHWQRALPGRILEVSYEKLVDAQEAGSRDILAYCGLPWNDACLNFHENAAPVTTASATQVREPMYRRALDRWRHYEPQLGELKTLLREQGVTLPD